MGGSWPRSRSLLFITVNNCLSFYVFVSLVSSPEFFKRKNVFTWKISIITLLCWFCTHMHTYTLCVCERESIYERVCVCKISRAELIISTNTGYTSSPILNFNSIQVALLTWLHTIQCCQGILTQTITVIININIQNKQ